MTPTERLLRKLFPWTVHLIEFRQQGKVLDEFCESLTEENPPLAIYEAEHGRYLIKAEKE